MPPSVTRKEHAGGAAPTTLTASMSVSDTSFTIASNTGWPTGAVGPFYVVIDPGTASEEKVLCSLQSVSVVTVSGGGRGADGTTAKSHAIAAAVYPVWAAAEADELNAHANATQQVHGIGAADSVVGTATTQTLTNKTMSGASNSFSNIPIGSVPGAQPVDSDLTAVAGLATTGLIVRTGAGTATTRTLTSSDAALVITNGDGVAGAPSFAIAEASLTGIPQSAVTSLSTPPQVDVFTAGGTWTKAAGAVYVHVRVQAAGASGAGAATTGAAQATTGGGGGGGGYAESTIPAASLGATETVTVGAGGVGGVGTVGTAGGGASYGAHVTANGGAVAALLAAGATPAWATGGDGGGAAVVTGVGFAVNGGDGGFGIRPDTSALARGGPGGTAMLAGSQRPSNNSNVDGFTGQSYGGGGSGGNNAASQGTARSGGDGAPGIVIVTTYFSG